MQQAAYIQATGSGYASLNITGCNYDTYFLGQDTNAPVELCTVTCPDPEITDKVARENCNGTKFLALTYLCAGSCIHKLYDKCATKIK
jgi:hypothetical protein